MTCMEAEGQGVGGRRLSAWHTGTRVGQGRGVWRRMTALRRIIHNYTPQGMQHVLHAHASLYKARQACTKLALHTCADLWT